MTGSLHIVEKLRSRFNRLQRDAGWGLGFNRTGPGQARGARILVYHGICQDDPLRFNTLFVRLTAFEKQLQLYKKYFNLISLDDYYAQRFSKDQFNICLSFDDGFANNYKYVLPLLEKYQAPAAFFITAIRDLGYDILWNDVLSLARRHGPSKFIFQGEVFIKDSDGKYFSYESDETLVDRLRKTGFEEKAAMIKAIGPITEKINEDYWLQMTENQIKEMSASPWVTIGSHSYCHNDLAGMPAGEVEEDSRRSKYFLEKLIGKEICSLAFPYGSYSEAVVEKTKKAGFTQLLTTGFLFPGDEDDPSLQDRLTINPFISPVNQLHANITGNYR